MQANATIDSLTATLCFYGNPLVNYPEAVITPRSMAYLRGLGDW